MKEKSPIDIILAENDKRNAVINAKFNPITGEGSTGDRVRIEISDFSLPVQWIPADMMKVKLVKLLVKAGSIKEFHKKNLSKISEYNAVEKEKIVKQFIRVRCKYDFPFWCAAFVRIQSKEPGEGEIPFRLNRTQRGFTVELEKRRREEKPIRFVMLKSRQWGGSTTSQIYMNWLQLCHKPGLNSLIIAQTKKTSFVIKDMLDRVLKSYPTDMLYKLGEDYNDKDPKMVNVGHSGDLKRIPQRDCTITVASYEAPEAIHGSAYALVHCSEVGLWEPTEKKSPESIVQAISGIPYKPYTMIIYESTAKGMNFFQKEYAAAKNGTSLFEPLFVPWYDIDIYRIEFNDENEKKEFAMRLYDDRLKESVDSNREEPGTYLWWLWDKKGATLEAINWYITDRKGKNSHALMAAQYPSDDIEAFTFSGRMVFDREDIEPLRPACKPPYFVGEIYGRADTGEDALEGLRIRKEINGQLSVWQDVEKDDGEDEVTDRYLVVVDVCKGHTTKADYAVICVFDRINMIDADRPSVVAQWYGHIDMDLLAWKATQIAHYYNDALLVIESNTLETNNTKGEAEYILNVIRDVYDNLYARKQSAEDIREGAPRKYGFHTNRFTKSVIINNLKAVIREHMYTERDEGCLDEYATYIETEKGGYEAMQGYHDDKLMTRAIGLHICYNEMDLPTIRKKSQKFVKPKRVISEASM